MELEELQKAWKELNERVSQNELVHQQQIIEMLSRQKESCLQRMLRMDKIASIFMLGVTILMFVDFIHLNGKLVFWPAIFGLLLYALTVNFAGVILLTKIKKETVVYHKKCAICDVAFSTILPQQIYCSPKCAKIAHKNQKYKQKICARCGAAYITRHKKTKYCPACAAEYMTAKLNRGEK